MIDTEKKFVWDVVMVGDEDGKTYESRFAARWSPEKDFITSESVAAAAAGQAFVEGGRKQRFHPVSAQLVAAPKSGSAVGSRGA